MMKEYILGKRRTLSFILVLNILFVLVFYLYDLAMGDLVYIMALSSTLTLGYLSYDFYCYTKKMKALKHYASYLDVESYVIPEHPELYEKTYGQLLNRLYAIYMETLSQAEQKEIEMLDYYSLWVHQIKTPIAAMHLNLQNSPKPNLILENELFKIEQYVEMVLSYLRLESTSSDYCFEEIDVDEVIREVIHKYMRLFIQKRLSLNFEATELKVLSDEKWLAFVLEQLLSNAIKYTDKGGIHIYAKEKVLYIQDSGIGISAEDLPRIFEKGYTGYNGREDKKSTGIGLYLVKQVCQRLDIDIDITSTYQQGTCVALNLEIEQLNVE